MVPVSPPALRGLLRVLLLALVGAVVVAGAATLSPIRWDLKTIGQVVPELPSEIDLSRRHVLFVSNDDTWENAHLARYGIDFITFPEGSASWLVFSEGISHGGARPDYVIDSTGEVARWKRGSWWPVSEESRPELADAFVLVSSEATRVELSERWPALETRLQNVQVVDPTPDRSFWTWPDWRVTFADVMRLFGALLLPVAALSWVVARRNESDSLVTLDLTLILPVILAGHILLVYGLGFLTEHSVAVAMGLEIMLACGLALASGGLNNARKVLPDLLPKSLRGVTPWLLGAAIFFTVVILRLDFDGDFYTHWLPAARMHYLEGHHDPEILAARYGVAHQATYPPAIPIMISTLLWIAGVSGENSFALGADSHFSILLYRTLLAALLFSFLGAVAAVFRAVTSEKTLEWLIPALSIPLVLPLFRGVPEAGEVFFTPMLGFSSVLFIAGGALAKDRYVRLGLAMAVFGAFVKNDAILIVPLIVLPWYLALVPRSGCGRRAVLADMTVALLAALPVVLWRVDVASAIDNFNFMFENIGPRALLSKWTEWPPLLMSAVLTIIRDDEWIILLLGLPAVVLYRILVSRRWKELVVPAGIAVYSIGISYMFVFSKSDPLEHLSLAYPRLLSHAVLAGILYVSWVMLADVRGRTTRKGGNDLEAARIAIVDSSSRR